MGYNRYDGEKIYNRRTQTSRVLIRITITLSVSLVFTIGIVVWLLLSRSPTSPPSILPNPTAQLPTNPTNQPTAVPTAAPTNSAHFWKSNPVQGGMIVHGPGVISGDLDVNETRVHQGIADEGTVIILEDNATYTLSAPNAGTIYTPENWQPTLDDLQAKAQQLVNDQHIEGCQAGCTNSYVATFQNGKETSARVQNSTQ